MKTDEVRLRAAIEKLEAMCKDQAERGAQSRNLGDGYLAVGQFLAEPDSTQAGLHGTAAAVSILKNSSVESRTEVIGKLGSGLVRRKDVLKLKAGKLKSDSNNIIKKAELVHALTGIPPTPVEAELSEYRSKLISELGSSRLSKGWPYFSYGTRKDVPELLPSIFALWALDSANVVVPAEIVKSIVDQLTGTSDQPYDFSIQIFGIYVVLGLSATRLPDDLKKKCLTAFDGFVRRNSGNLSSPVEANIQYVDGSQNLYVRIPWQLYFVQVAAQWRTYRLFASSPFQSFVDAVVTDTLDGGFIFPHSGSEVSTRTSAIVCTLLRDIEPIYRDKTFKLRAALTANAVRRFFGRRRFRFVAAASAAGVAVLSTWAWVVDGKGLADLGPEFVSSILILALVSSKDGR